MSVERREESPSPVGRRWVGYLPSVVVVLALMALLAGPLLVERRTEVPRQEIEQMAEPGRTLVTRIQYLLARQTSSLRGYLLTRDRRLLDRYHEMAAYERAALAELAPVARRLGPEVLAAYVELRTRSEHWHERVERDLAEVELGPLPVGEDLPFEQGLYLEALRAGNTLDDALLQASRQRRAQIRDLEAQALLVTAVLILLALGATLSVAWLGRRVERLALEAERRRREAERALQETARTVESRAVLIRGVTHDVKNPLGVADGYADLLAMGLKGELAPAQMEVVAKIRRSIHSALDIINDLLELSRAESGGLRLRWERMDPRVLVARVVEEYQGAVESGGQELTVDLPGECPPVRSDGDRVRQVLGNLLGNAVKYTPAGGRIVVQLSPGGSEGPRTGSWVAVRVQDTGPGIPDEHRERLFGEFYRVPGSTAAGHGLGLAISRRIARLLGGDLTVESEVGKGSIFTLWLPAHSDGAAATDPGHS